MHFHKFYLILFLGFDKNYLNKFSFVLTKEVMNIFELKEFDLKLLFNQLLNMIKWWLILRNKSNLFRRPMSKFWPETTKKQKKDFTENYILKDLQSWNCIFSFYFSLKKFDSFGFAEFVWIMESFTTWNALILFTNFLSLIINF